MQNKSKKRIEAGWIISSHPSGNFEPTNSSKLKYYYIIGKQRVCHTVALPITFKGILRQKKSYRNSNISPCKDIIFKKSSKTNQNKSFKIL
jgi:hypothetical protein